VKRKATARRARPWHFDDVNAAKGLDQDHSEILHLDGYLE
jgi:hypothetical protein